MFENNNFANPMMGGMGMPMNMGMGMGIQTGTGYQYNGVPTQNAPVIKNNLTDEEIQKLVQKENQFSLNVTETERLRAACSHRWQGGLQDSIAEDEEGNCVCQICGYKFVPVDTSTTPDSLQEYVNNIIDVLQTIKMLYIDMPEDVAREYFVIIPLIEKIPKLFELAAKSWSRYSNFTPYGYNARNMNTMQMFNMLSGVLSGASAMNMAPQQPQMFQQPTMNGMGYNPGMMGGMGFNPYGASNGFVAQDPNAYAAQTGNFSYVPNATPQQQPQNPGQVTPQTTATTDGKEVAATATFKA